MKFTFCVVILLLVPGCITQTWFSRVYEFVRCPFTDCCNDYWVPSNVDIFITELRELLRNEVFGQHIATDAVFKQVQGHLSNPNPSKPLVMSFHGWTGNGKNHVAYLLAKSLFLKGPQSAWYHHFMATVHFPHQNQAHVYQDQLRNWIKGNMTRCPRSLFVFDEIDKMPSGVLDGIRAYLDYNEHVDGVDYRKAMFIFLSNTGGNEITNLVEQTGRREDLVLKDFEKMVELGMFNENGGLHQSHIIEKALIDMYVPFLPMEKKHVRMCIKRQFELQAFIPKNMEKAVEAIVNSLHYYPPGLELYSQTGCKRVAQKVEQYVIAAKYDDMRGGNKNEL